MTSSMAAAPRAGQHDTLTGGAGSNIFVFGQGYGAETITDFDQGSGTFNSREGDLIELSGFNGPPTVSYVPDGVTTDTVLTFSTGDVLTLQGVTSSRTRSVSAASTVWNSSSTCNAEPITWTGHAGDGEWSTAGGNWSYEQGAPGPTEEVQLIAVAGTYTVTVDMSDTVDALNVSNSSATLAIEADVTLTVGETWEQQRYAGNIISGVVQQ